MGGGRVLVVGVRQPLLPAVMVLIFYILSKRHTPRKITDFFVDAEAPNFLEWSFKGF